MEVLYIIELNLGQGLKWPIVPPSPLSFPPPPPLTTLFFSSSFFTKWWSYPVEGLLETGPTQSSLNLCLFLLPHIIEAWDIWQTIKRLYIMTNDD